MDPSRGAAAADDDDAGPAPIRFRPSKRRKTLRQRAAQPPDRRGPSRGSDDDDGGGRRAPGCYSDGDDEDDDADDVVHSRGRDPHAPEDHDEDAAPVVRRRNVPRRAARFRGIAFSSSSSGARPAAAASSALVPRGHHDGHGAPEDDDRPVVRGIADRFMHQTGLVADPDDRHMTEYIESRLASRLAASSAPKPAATGGRDAGQPPAPSTASAIRAGDQPTKHGKLFEVDIPADVRNRRDESRKRLAAKTPKPRSGRNRRNSDDVKRDQFVEQFLHENRLDVYDFPEDSPQPLSSAASDAASADHRTADDRMAEQFRRQYLDDLAQRRQRRRHAHAPRQQPPPGDVLRGPKLGGSRNSRAAVRNLLLQQKEKLGRKV